MNAKQFLKSKGIITDDNNQWIVKFDTGVSLDIGNLMEQFSLQDQKPNPISLSNIQDQLPWTIKYSKDFRANPQVHKDFSHALIHTIKASGKIAGYIDDLDHRSVNSIPANKLADYISDLVICAMRMANESPVGKFDLHAAVERRLETKNEIQLKR